jgi:hypothetical protein
MDPDASYISPTLPSGGYTHVDDIFQSLSHQLPATTPVDLAEKIKGMYRLLDLTGESGSNGYGEGYLETPNPRV